MIEINTKQQNGYIPYSLRYKEEQQDSKGLFLTTAIFGSGYLMFLAIIGLKLGLL